MVPEDLAGYAEVRLRPADPRCRRRDLVHALELPRCARRPRGRHRPAGRVRRRRPVGGQEGRRHGRGLRRAAPRSSRMGHRRGSRYGATAARRAAAQPAAPHPAGAAARSLDCSEHPFRPGLPGLPPIEHAGGIVAIPDGPGLGIVVDRAALERFAVPLTDSWIPAAKPPL